MFQIKTPVLILINEFFNSNYNELRLKFQIKNLKIGAIGFKIQVYQNFTKSFAKIIEFCQKYQIWSHWETAMVAESCQYFFHKKNKKKLKKFGVGPECGSLQCDFIARRIKRALKPQSF